MEYPPFPGFRPEAFSFLRELAVNNQRDWFKPRKSIYEDEVLWPLRCLIADCSQRAYDQRIPLLGDPDRAVFRIYRDTRFSKNKDPYKTHAGAVLTRTGGREDTGVVYIHVEPEKSFLAAGFWQPEPDFVRRWRALMINDSDAFPEMLDTLEANGLAFETEAPLKRMPQGYEAYAEHPHAVYFKWKSYLVSRKVADEDMQTPGFADAVLQMMRDSRPLLEFGWQAEGSRKEV